MTFDEWRKSQTPRFKAAMLKPDMREVWAAAREDCIKQIESSAAELRAKKSAEFENLGQWIDAMGLADAIEAAAGLLRNASPPKEQ